MTPPPRLPPRPVEPADYNSLKDPHIWLAIGTGLAMLVFFILLIVLNEPSPLKNPATWLAVSFGVGMLVSFILAIVLKKP